MAARGQRAGHRSSPVGDHPFDGGPATLVELLRTRVLDEGDRRAFTFLADGDAGELHVSYADLDRRARAIACCLQEQGAAGEPVLLLLPSSFEYVAAFFGCLYAGAVAIPAYPPRRNQSLDRIEAIVADARPALALVAAPALASFTRLAEESPGLKNLRCLAVDRVPDDLAAHWQAPAVQPESLAFLQYTSGSTRTPRGVMISHRNVLHNSWIIARTFGLGAADVGVTWLPIYHDLGLIGGIVQPVYSGFPVVVFSPVAFLQRPLRWLRAISRYGGTVSGGPTFALDLCVRRSRPEEHADLDLSTWNGAFLGGEPVRHDVLERFVETFAPVGFRREALCPGYGLAEATMFFSASGPEEPPLVVTVQRTALEQHQLVEMPAGHPDGQPFVGCGRNISDQRLAIVRPESCERRGDDEIGEIWIAGPSISQGYRDRPEETAAAFGGYLADGDGPYLRTGDLGFVRGGEIFITGRLKDLIIVRGRNHYPQDLERTVEQSHPALVADGGAAFAVECDGEERLVVACEVGREWLGSDSEEIVWAVRQAVAEAHDVELEDVVLLMPGGLPRTSSGKVRRRACHDGFLARTLRTWNGWTERPDGWAADRETARV